MSSAQIPCLYIHGSLPPINPTPHLYLRVLQIRTLLYPGLRGRW